MQYKYRTFHNNAPNQICVYFVVTVMSDNEDGIIVVPDGDVMDAPAEGNELVTLSLDLPLWQRDALRRIAQHGALSAADKDTLRSAMYADHALGKFEEELIPFGSDHCQANPADAPLAMLCSIGPVEHINRLAGDQPPLQFAPKGVTLIYGDNGSGKSGYIRISKKVCRARTEDDLLGNAYAERVGEPKAHIRWQVGGGAEVKTLAWNPNQPPPPELSTISVFDSKHAAVYVDAKRQMAFLPFEVELYKQLADLVSGLELEVSEEIKATEKAFAIMPVLTPGTKAAALVGAVTGAASEGKLPSEADIQAFIKWGAEDGTRLNELRILAAETPLNQANRRARCGNALSSIAVKAELLEEALSKENATELEQKFRALVAAKAANDLAAKSSFSDLPLGEVGSEIWKTFFHYAREYAGLAYPGQEFPYTGEDAKCVLCQQPLDEDARARFVRFDHFITGKAAEDFKAKSEEYTNAVQGLANLDVPSADDVAAMLAEYAELSGERAKDVAGLLAFLDAVGKRRDAFFVAANTGNFSQIGDEVKFVTVLHGQIKLLQDEEAQFRKDAQDDKKQQVQASELAELEGRKSLADNAANLLNNRANREKWLRLKACAGAISTGNISRIVSKLREEHLTSELNGKIRVEIRNLGLSYLNVSLKDETKKGGSNFWSDLGFRQPIKVNSTVLSEGEQRGLALACYLAEADMKPTKHGLIVDDPVSSLDHQRIELVAKRLVEEAARGRQVIIFTHNLLFYQEVINQAGEKQVELAKNTIHRNVSGVAGIVEADAVPYQARNVTERIGAVRTELARMKKTGLDPVSDDYRKAVEGVCTELRKAWERLVEEVLLNKAVQRFAYGIQTLRLKEVVVEDEDYRKIFLAMERLSSFAAHDEAAGKQGQLPTIDQLTEAVDDIDAYAKAIVDRRKTIKKNREKPGDPPKAKFV